MVGSHRLLLFLCLLLSGCSRASSPLTRLKRDSPVQSQAVLVQHMEVNQQVNARLLEIYDVSRGDLISLTGTLAPKAWGLSGITATWQPRDGEPASFTSPSRQMTDRTLLLMIFLHGDDVTKDLGVIHSEMVEAKLSKDVSGTVEFRTRFSAPRRSGKYVMDLQLIDQSESQPRGVTRKKPNGFPIWRCEINVR